MIAGWQITAAIALGASVVAFGAGWASRGWKCDAALLEQQESAQRAFEDQLARQQNQSTAYEQEREHGNERKEAAASEIRTIYKDRVISADCALASRGVLQGQIDAANARITGEPGRTVSEDTADPGSKP